MGNKPFLLRPSGKDYLWGGSRLKTEFNKEIDLEPLAETWECSTHKDGPSYVVNGEHKGKTLAEVLKMHPEYVGSHPETKGDIPILIKFIDADKDLSLQVHPSDEYAKEHENGQQGKTEMWYVLDAKAKSRLVFGLNNDSNPEKIRTAIEKGTVMKYMQRVPVSKGNIFFVEPGTIHAIGEGCIIAEIQENSNLTYRLYDYDRVDAKGNKRELHVDKALAVARMKSSANPRQPLRVLKYRPGEASELICRCKYFEVNRILVNTEDKNPMKFQSDDMSFRVLLCLEGCVQIRVSCGKSELAKTNEVDGEGVMTTEEVLIVEKGQCVFVPAESEEILIDGKAEFLDVRC